ncbi:hypothetical protein [Streptomyces sp. NPDC093261]|uniref:hypothetical protein n=1 Tax=Streptomyces sp. NPDC093261 TaxID=3366037 RepID=UPI0037FAA312
MPDLALHIDCATGEARYEEPTADELRFQADAQAQHAAHLDAEAKRAQDLATVRGVSGTPTAAHWATLLRLLNLD